MTTMTTMLPIQSNRYDEEYFRLYGTLRADRIAQLLDAEAATIAAAVLMNEHIEGIPDGMPCEDFADAIIGQLESLLVDHETTDTLRKDIEEALEAVHLLQADLFKRAEAALVHLRAVEDELQAWVQS